MFYQQRKVINTKLLQINGPSLHSEVEYQFCAFRQRIRIKYRIFSKSPAFQCYLLKYQFLPRKNVCASNFDPNQPG